MTTRIAFGLALLAAAALFGCSRASQPQTGGALAARVNGKDILRSDVEKYFSFKSQEAPQKPTGDAATLAKMEIVRDMIERELMAQKAEQLKLKVKDADVDAQLQELRGPETPEQFRQELERRAFTEQDMRKEIRGSLTVQMLVQDQIGSKIQIGDAEIRRFYDENRETFNIREPQFRLAQIVVTPNPGGTVTNARTDKALNPDQAVAKVQHIVELLKAGQDFQQVAREYSEDPQTAREGGDLGYQPESSLDRLGPQLKQAIVKLNVGDTTPVMQSPDGFWILKLLGRREPGQKTLQDAEVAAGIRDELRNRKQQLLMSAFSEELHNSAHVENFLAQEILAGFQKAK